MYGERKWGEREGQVGCFKLVSTGRWSRTNHNTWLLQPGVSSIIIVDIYLTCIINLAWNTNQERSIFWSPS